MVVSFRAGVIFSYCGQLDAQDNMACILTSLPMVLTRGLAHLAPLQQVPTYTCTHT